MDDGGDVLVGWVGGMACQHSDGIGDIRSSSHHEVHELTDGGLEGPNQAGVGILLGFWIGDKVLSWEDGVTLLDLSIVLDYVGDGLFGEANLVEHNVLVSSGTLTCNANSKEVLGVAGVGDVIVLWDVLSLGARGPGNQQKHLEYIAGSG